MLEDTEALQVAGANDLPLAQAYRETHKVRGARRASCAVLCTEDRAPAHSGLYHALEIVLQRIVDHVRR